MFENSRPHSIILCQIATYIKFNYLVRNAGHGQRDALTSIRNSVRPSTVRTVEIDLNRRVYFNIGNCIRGKNLVTAIIYFYNAYFIYKQLIHCIKTIL